MASSDNGELRVYAVRLAVSAGREIAEEHGRLTSQISPKTANDWRSGLLDSVRTLATLPERCAVAPEDNLFQGDTIRQLLRRHKSGPTWRILFVVHEADENDPALVKVHHIRHGAQAPMTEWPEEDE